MSRLDNKVALITGGTSGMGAATARLFADEGATVVVTGSNPDTLEKARAAMPGIEVLASDASDLPAIRSLIAGVKAWHGRIDVLFVNAGTAGYVPYDQVDEPFFDRVFNLNVKGAAFLMQEAAPIMPDGSTMILTGSMAHA
ncbi:SDR family NAD(P)-dependent oxidoreductase, partial [Thioclava sp. BHET1]